VPPNGEHIELSGALDSYATERALGHEFPWHVVSIDRVELYN
jgi:hypothetical protein